MNDIDKLKLSSAILRKARELGADVGGNLVAKDSARIIETETTVIYGS